MAGRLDQTLQVARIVQHVEIDARLDADMRTAERDLATRERRVERCAEHGEPGTEGLGIGATEGEQHQVAGGTLGHAGR